jgi:hypothetical protein
MRRRKATIDLLHAIMPENGVAIAVAEIRRRLAAGASNFTKAGQLPTEGELRVSSLLLTILQARQLQRLATESMMLWVERSLSTEVAKARLTEDLVADAHAAAARHDAMAKAAGSVGAYMDAVEALGAATGWPRAAGMPGSDIVELMDHLQEAQHKDVTRVPALALCAFAIVYAVTRALRGEECPSDLIDPIEARPDRLPMGVMVRRIQAVWNRPIAALWRDIIENWIIAQHVHWSAVRGTDGKKRLRNDPPPRGAATRPRA